MQADVCIKIEDRLRFSQQISNSCSKAALQLNALGGCKF